MQADGGGHLSTKILQYVATNYGKPCCLALSIGSATSSAKS